MVEGAREALAGYCSNIEEDLGLLRGGSLAPGSRQELAVQVCVSCNRLLGAVYTELLAMVPLCADTCAMGGKRAQFKEPYCQGSPLQFKEPYCQGSPRKSFLCDLCMPSTSCHPSFAYPQVRLGEKEALDSLMAFFEGRAADLRALEYYQVCGGGSAAWIKGICLVGSRRQAAAAVH
jgi:hypothetical protein